MHNDILVLGGSGFVGRHVVEKLVDRNHGGSGRVIVPSRRPARARHIQLLPTAEVVEADVLDRAQLDGLVAQADAVINLVAILHGSEPDFERVHVGLPRSLAEICMIRGVRRVIHVSALGAAPDGPSRYQRSKAAGEEALRKPPGLALTVLRPSVIFGEEDHFLNLFASLQRVFPIMPLAGADARFQPVWVEDVAQAIVHCLDDETTVGRTYECVGPEVFTLRELVRAAGAWSGNPRPILPLPAPLGRLQALAMECLPGDPLMSRDNLDSMRVPNVASGKLPGLQALGIEPASLPSIARRYLSGEWPRARYDLFRTSARRD